MIKSKYCHGCGKELTDNDRMYELYCDVNCIDEGDDEV